MTSCIQTGLPIEHYLALNRWRMIDLFHAADTDRDGYLDHDEFIGVFKTIQAMGSDSDSKGELGSEFEGKLEELFHSVDADANGQVDYHEFLTLRSADPGEGFVGGARPARGGSILPSTLRKVVTTSDYTGQDKLRDEYSVATGSDLVKKNSLSTLDSKAIAKMGNYYEQKYVNEIETGGEGFSLEEKDGVDNR